MNRKWLVVAFAGAALLAGVACGGTGGDDDDGGLSSGVVMTDAGGADAARESADSPSKGVAGQGGGNGETPPMSSMVDRKIIVNGNLSLEVPDVTRAFSEAGRVARNAGGFVEESRLTARSGGDGKEEPYGTLVLRVPIDQYDAVVAALQGIDGAEPVSEGVTSQEVTEEYTDLQSRLRNLERSETQYLELLAQAKTIDEILTVSDRVDGVRAQIEQIQGRINLLDSLTAYATVDVALAPIAPALAKEEGRNGPLGAFADAWEVSLEVASGVAVAGVYVLVAAAWLAIPGAVALGGWAMARRHNARGAGTAA